MAVFRLICAILLLALKAFGVYFTVVALFTVLPRRRFLPAPYRTRFAVLAAARNEEGVIANFVESVRAQNYPPDLFDVFVVPNNCTDGTEAAAAAAGRRGGDHPLPRACGRQGRRAAPGVRPAHGPGV